MKRRYVLLGALTCALLLTGAGAIAAATAPSGPPILDVAGTGTACSTPPACGDGAAATTGQLNFPEGVAVDSHGNVYVADWGDNEVRRIAPDGTITTIAGGGAPCWSPPGCGDGAAATDAELSFPNGVAVGPDGSIYIADTGNNEIRKVSPSGTITRFAGTGSGCSQPPNCGDGGPATNAQLSAPAAVAVDRSGAVYVADTGDSELRKVSPSGTITRIAGTGVFCASAPSCGDGGPATSAQLNFPGGIAVDQAGNLLIADGGDHEVRKVLTSATITRVAGSGKQCSAPAACGDGSAATSAQLNGPDGVAVAANGTLYIADSGDNEVRRVSAAGKISSVAGTGAECAVPSSCGDGGPATSAQLNYPEAVTLDSSGDLYIADTYDAEVRFVPGGSTATLSAPTGRIAVAAVAASVSSAAVTIRYALSAPAAMTLSVGAGATTTVAAHAAGRPGLDVLVWNRRLGASPAPRGRYTLTLTASAGGHSASVKLPVRLT
jgi:Fe-S cluster biogenesis protein NfuA